MSKNSCSSSTGPVWSFTYCETPATPSGSAPVDGAILTVQPTKLDWANTSGATSYDVYLRLGSGSFTKVGADLTVSEWLPNQTYNATSFSWYVVAKNSCSSTTGPTWSYTICPLPGTPNNPTPVNGATASSQPTVLDWADTGGATSYDVYLDGTLRANVSVSQWTLNQTLSTGLHNWYIVAKSGCGSVTGTTWSFTICPLPDTPSTPTPVNGATVSSQPTMLDWADTSGATSYDVYLDGTFRANVSVSQWTLNQTLNFSSHNWYVVAKNGCGSTTGTTWSFTIVSPPTVTVVTPNGGEVLGTGSIHYITAAVSGTITGWQVEYSTDGGGSWNFITGLSTANTTISIPWTVPNSPSATCRVKVTVNYIGGSVVDTSNGSFTIAQTQYGVTVVTHGYVFGSIDVTNSWLSEMGIAILNRVGRGRLWYFDVWNDEIQDITTSQTFRPGFVPDSSGEQVILIDWQNTANNTFEASAGHAEGVGQSVYALLMGGASGDSGFVGSSGTRKPLHFIGHSFGCVVNSEAIQRLGLQNIEVEQMTTLDPHDWDENLSEGVADDVDGKARTPDVHVWSNVIRADNYYATSGGDNPANPHGRPVTGAQNYDLTSFEGFYNGHLYYTHSRVHTYYHGTIDPSRIGLSVDGYIVDSTWYPELFSRRGFSYSRLGGKSYLSDFNDEGHGSDSLTSPPANSTRINFNGQPDIGIDPPTAIFNSTFWLAQHGSGAGFTDEFFDDSWYGTPLNDGNYARRFDILNSDVRSHLTYVPTDATSLRFKVKMNILGVWGTDDTFHVSFNGSQLGGAITIWDTGGFVTFTRDMTSYRGQSGYFTFDLNGNGILDSTVWLDDLNLDTTPPDTTAPTVTINQAAVQSDPTGNSPINFTVVFSEAVTGFASGDVALAGVTGANSKIVTGSGTTFNVAVSGMTQSGTVIVNIPAGAAQDGAGNPSLASTSSDNSVTYNMPDTTPPTVTINQAAGQSDPTGNSSINFTVVFSEAVTGFANGDITLSGTANATSRSVTGSVTTYNVAVSGMTQSGTVIATIPAGAAQDGAGNNSLTSTSSDNSVTYNAPDITPPTVTINRAAGQSDPTSSSPINFTVVFSESVTGFGNSDVTLGGTAGASSKSVSGTGTTYNVAVSGMTLSGTVTATIPAGAAQDGAGNGNTVSTSSDNDVAYNAPDITLPTVTINRAAGQSDPTSSSPINFTVVFSESVTGFGSTDVTLGGTAGATSKSVSGTGTTYNVAVSGMTQSGTVTATIPADAAQDGAGNGNTPATWTDNSVDYNHPTPQLAISPSSLTNYIAQGQNATNQSFEVWNAGAATLNYTNSVNQSWLSVVPTNGDSTGEHDSIQVTFTTSALAAGTHNAIITIKSQVATNTIPVTLTVLNPPAQSLVVTTTSDSGQGSLRSAMLAANAIGGGDITFSNVSGTITLQSPLPDIANNINILGPGCDIVSVSGGNLYRVFTLLTNKTCLMSGLTIRDGFINSGTITDHGGGIYSEGNLTILNSCIMSNRTTIFAVRGWGGGIFSSGSLTLSNTVLVGNAATDIGGAIWASGSLYIYDSEVLLNRSWDWMGGISFSGGALKIVNTTIKDNLANAVGGLGVSIGVTGIITNSTISGNTSGDYAGGGGLENYGDLLLVNTTLSGNQAWLDGGGIRNFGNITAQNCTIVSNIAGFQYPGFVGGGVTNGGMFVAKNTIIANNIALSASPDFAGVLTSQGYNLVGNISNTVIAGDVTGNIYWVDPRLGPLQDNGGFTWTHALLPGSPCLNAGTSIGAPSADQRGVIRPQGAAVDIGAFESQYAPPAMLGLAVQPGGNQVIQWFGHPALTNTLQGSSNLANWVNIGSVTRNPGGLYAITNQDLKNHPRRFYRAVESGRLTPVAYLPATLGNVTGPYTTTNSFLYHTTNAEANINFGGRAAYNFSVPTAGNYVIQFLMNAPDDGHNSFWLNIGGEPSGDTMVWDIPITLGFEQRIAGWRGVGGTFDNNLLVPKIFSLPAGINQLVIRGREHGSSFQSIVIMKLE